MQDETQNEATNQDEATDQNVPPAPPPTKPETSSMPAQCGRIVHVYSQAWEGPRPGLVLAQVHGESHDQRQLVAVNVMLDGLRDESVLRRCRNSKSGNTLIAPLFDPQTPEQRRSALAAARPCGQTCGIAAIAEWPPRAS